jgi:hypothetical protein
VCSISIQLINLITVFHGPLSGYTSQFDRTEKLLMAAGPGDQFHAKEKERLLVETRDIIIYNNTVVCKPVAR